MILHLCSLPPKNVQVWSTYEKNIREIQVEGRSTKHLTGIPQDCEGHQHGVLARNLAPKKGH